MRVLYNSPLLNASVLDCLVTNAHCLPSKGQYRLQAGTCTTYSNGCSAWLRTRRSTTRYNSGWICLVEAGPLYVLCPVVLVWIFHLLFPRPPARPPICHFQSQRCTAGVCRVERIQRHGSRQILQGDLYYAGQEAHAPHQRRARRDPNGVPLSADNSQQGMWIGSENR